MCSRIGIGTYSADSDYLYSACISSHSKLNALCICIIVTMNGMKRGCSALWEQMATIQIGILVWVMAVVSIIVGT